MGLLGENSFRGESEKMKSRKELKQEAKGRLKWALGGRNLNDCRAGNHRRLDHLDLNGFDFGTFCLY